MPDSKRILIVGGGYAGVTVAKVLEKAYRKRNDIEIILVDRHPFHTLMTELHEVAGWRTEPESVQVSFRKIFGGTKVKVVTDKVLSINFDANEAVLSSSTIKYDHILIGAGADPDFFLVPGIKENAFTLWSFDDAMRLRRHLEDIWAVASAESDPVKRKNLLTFAVAGAGFTGIEMVGEILELKKVMCKKHHIDEKDVRVVVIEALPFILSMLAESQRVKALSYLAKHNCALMLSAPITGAEDGVIHLKDGSSVQAGTFIWTCGVSGSQFSGSLGLEAKRNRIVANDNMRVEGKDNVWIAGDNLWFAEGGKPLPQIVETAHQTGEVAAHNIIAAIDGGKMKSFKSNYHGFMVSIGGKYGVADAGGIKTSGCFAMAMKHMINLYYLFTIAGVNQCWEYGKHEFLDIKNRRSIIGGFAEYKVRSYWIVLLRFWLGFSWIIEGVNKISEGWLNFGLGSKSAWMFSPGVVQGGPAVDAATAATEAVVDTAAVAAVAVADAVSEASVEVGDAIGTAADAVGQTADAVVKALGPFFDMTKSILDPSGVISTWYRTTFMDGMLSRIPFQFFQSMIVFTEIGIGLALFGGAFTWWAAVASIVMCVIFTLSGMFRWDQLWFVFAAIMCMGGAGRAFGLDYWIVRFAKKIWNGFAWVRRRFIYLDEPTK